MDKANETMGELLKMAKTPITGNKILYLEADRLKDDAWNSDSKHCFSIDHQCDYLRATKDAYGTGDSPSGKQSVCP